MERSNLIADRTTRTLSLLGGLLLISLLLFGCAHQKPKVTVSQFRFEYNNSSYRIRSITSTEKSQSYNEIIGEKFMAADYDQDRVIDTILMGDVSLGQAQKIYEYGLNEVAKEKKLRVKIPSINRYLHEKNNIQLEIRTFRPTSAQPFNEFKIIDNRPFVQPEITIIADHDADGVLDEVLKGSVSLEKAQASYAEAIAAGLEKGELVRANGRILVKAK